MSKIIIRAPKGFRVLYHINTYNKQIESVYCELYDMSKDDNFSIYSSIGNIELVRGIGKVFETHSSLSYDYHGRGLGTLLYSKAIAWALNHGFKVRSSGDSSDKAKNVWKGKSLRKHFNIRKIRKTYPYSSYIKETWYANKKKAPTKRSNKMGRANWMAS